MHFDWETFTYDEEWLREAVRIEDEADCDISAGFDWGATLGVVMAHPERYSQLARLRSIVIREFKELLADWNARSGSRSRIGLWTRITDGAIALSYTGGAGAVVGCVGRGFSKPTGR